MDKLSRYKILCDSMPHELRKCKQIMHESLTCKFKQ